MKKRTYGGLNATLVLNLKKKISELKKSEERFRQVVENAREWVWEIDAEGVYTYSSPIVKDILGYDPNEIVNKKRFYDFFKPGKKAALKKGAFEAFIKKKKEFRNFININAHKDGREVILETSGMPILDSKGNLLGYRGVDIDVTEKKNVEQALKESEGRYREMFEGSADAIFIADFKTKKLVNCNKKAEELTGFSRKEILKMRADQLHPKDVVKRTMQDFKKHAKGLLIIVESEVLTKNSKRIPVSINSGLIVKGGKKLLQGVFRNITEQKKAEEELIRYKDNLEVMVKEKTKELHDQNFALVRSSIELAEMKKKLEDQNRELNETIKKMKKICKPGVK